MKETKALIQPHRLEAVLEASYADSRLPGVTVSEVQGFGRTVGCDNQPGANNAKYGTVNMAKVECMADDDMLDEIIEVVAKAAHTGGHPGDGKIVIYDVNDMVKIKTGERGEHVA